ncbi:hypothetical protein TURU_135447 [Turdus rufiventris]|nr:hypothetical protein TURU_135447 [Turdus rufiventris]
MPSSQATANLTHVPDTAERFITRAKSQEWEMEEEEEEENSSEQHGRMNSSTADVVPGCVMDPVTKAAEGAGSTLPMEGRDRRSQARKMTRDDPYINVNIYSWESFETSESPTTAFTNSGISDSSCVGLGLRVLLL